MGDPGINFSVRAGREFCTLEETLIESRASGSQRSPKPVASTESRRERCYSSAEGSIGGGKHAWPIQHGVSSLRSTYPSTFSSQAQVSEEIYLRVHHARSRP